MTVYGPDDVGVWLDIADGGALTDITQMVQSINGIAVERPVENSNTFGDVWEEFIQIGIKKVNELEIEGLYDDTASTGSNAVLNISNITHDVTRSFKIVFGSTKSASVEVWITSFERIPAKDKLTRYKAKLRPTGAVTEA